MQLTEIVMFSARREIAVDARAVGQHTDSRGARRGDRAATLFAVDDRIAGVGLQHRIQHAQRVVDLPAPFGPNNPVIWPSRALKLTARTAAILPNDFDEPSSF
jgi:hypothetical protein